MSSSAQAISEIMAAIPFELTKNETYTLISLKMKFGDSSKAHLLEEKMPDLLLPQPLDVIFDCSEIEKIDREWLRVLLLIATKLQKSNKQVRLISVCERLQKALKSEGVDTKIKIAATLKIGLAEVGVKKAASLDVDFINPFLVATLNVLKIQCQTEAKAGKPYQNPSTDKFSGDISGVIGLVSDAFTGSVVISFAETSFLKIISRMLGENITTITKDVQDGAGELTNIIFGQAKLALNEKGYGIKTALPSVITGTGHSVLQMTKGPRLVIPFETDVGPFFIEICVSGD